MTSTSKIRGAFCWFNDKKPSVAYMLVDEDGYKQVREAIRIYNNITDFNKSAENAIDKYFDLIDIEVRKGRHIKLKHKIVRHGAPVVQHWKKTKPSDKTNSIDQYFKNKLNKCKIDSIQITKPLDGKCLKEFVRYLYGLGLLKNKYGGRGEAFKHRLWAIILEATNKNYVHKLRPLWENITKPEGRMKEKTMQYKEWIGNH